MTTRHGAERRRAERASMNAEVNVVRARDGRPGRR